MNNLTNGAVYAHTSSGNCDLQKSKRPQNAGLYLKNREFGGSFGLGGSVRLCINEKLLCQKRSAYRADFRPYTAYMHISHHIFAYIQHAFIKIWLFQQTLIIDFCRIMSLPADPLTISSLGENKSGTISRNSTPPIPLLSVGQARPLVLLFLYSAPAPFDHSIHLRYAGLVF